jgi:2-dehydropantoate 2-reductase
MMRFIIYGAGAVGSIIGGHLYRTGHDVILVGNPKHIEKIKETGLRLIMPDVTYVLKMQAYKEAKELTPFGENDVILLTAKSQHTLLCLGQLKNAGAPRDLPIFCVQNSIFNEALATRVFTHIYGAVVWMPGIFLKPGEVINPILGKPGFLEVGLYPQGSDELTHKVSEAFKRADFLGGVNEWVMRAKAAKCLRNLGNALGAIIGSEGDSSRFMVAARKEAMEVWRTAGIEWEDSEKFKRRIRKGYGIYNMPKGYDNIHNLGSSWQSLMRDTGNIEAKQLNGDVVQLGRLLGIETPYNKVLWRIAEEMAKKGEKPGKYTIADLRRMVKELSYFDSCLEP